MSEAAATDMDPKSLELCIGYAGSIVEYFYSVFPADRMSDDAKAHLGRAAPYAICYAVAQHPDDPDWWNKTGNKYWKGHVANLARELPKNGMITSRILAVAMNKLADKTLKGLSTLLRFVEARELSRQTLRQDDERSEEKRPGLLGAAALNPESILELFLMCPWNPESRAS